MTNKTRTIEISDETYKRLKDQLCKDQKPAEPLKSITDMIDKSYFFRTVTYHAVGKVVGTVTLGGTGAVFVQLDSASWIASSGRFMQTIKDGTLDEVEPVGTMWLNLNTVVDMFPWTHALPSTQK